MKIEIERLGINGEGVGVFSEGKDSGKIIFVKNALPNENVEIDIIKDAKSFCVGKLINIYKQSSKRVTPKCKYYGLCGGCQLQHMSDDLQIDFKKESVKSTIKKISGLDLSRNYLRPFIPNFLQNQKFFIHKR
jgi:23S rRNA (uracil1939-C5)-methyltransferase